MIWDFTDIVDRMGQHLASREAALREEQAVYGLDSIDEVSLHDDLAKALSQTYSVAREVHYPSSVGQKRSHRSRCDLVLSALGRPLKRDTAPVTLFDPPDQTEPTDALWLEVKLAAQFQRPAQHHTGYGQQWRHAVIQDLRKMQNDPLIHHAALMLVVFTATRQIVEKDLQIFESDLITQNVIAGFRQVHHTPILDRMGHTCCTIAIWPV